MLALRSTFVNVGVVAGPALGALVYPLGFRYILAACICSHLVLGLLLATRRTLSGPAPAPTPAGSVEDEAAVPVRAGFGARWQWISLVIAGIAFWTIYSQFNLVMPITAQRLTGGTRAVSVVFTINGLLCVLFQYFVLGWLFARTATRTLLVLGFVAFAVAYTVLAVLSGWAALLVYVLPVTLGELLIAPSLDQQAILASSRRRTGLGLGVMSVAGSVGNLLGSIGGGHLLQVMPDSQVGIVIGALALVAAAGCLLLPKESMARA